MSSSIHGTKGEIRSRASPASAWTKGRRSRAMRPAMAPTRLPWAAACRAFIPFPSSSRRWEGRTERHSDSSGTPMISDGM